MNKDIRLLYITAILLAAVVLILGFIHIFEDHGALEKRLAALETKAHTHEGKWDVPSQEPIDPVEGEGEGEGEGYETTLAVKGSALLRIPLPSDFDLEYRWTLPPLDTTGMSEEEKFKKLFAAEEEVSELEKRLVGQTYNCLLEGCDVVHYIRQKIWLGNGIMTPVPSECADQLWPIIESYVAARRAQVDALRKEIEK